VKPARGLSRDVEESSRVNAHRFQETVHPADSQLGKIGEVAAEVRSTERRQRKDSLPPERFGEQTPSVEASHAVADDVDGFLGERAQDAVAEPTSAKLDTRCWMHAGHEHPVSRRPEGFWDTAKISRDGQWTQPDA
jgi:hypothetical protein